MTNDEPRSFESTETGTDEPEAYVAEDDSLIGKVFLWSIGVLLLGGIAAAAVIYLKSRPEAEERVETRPIEAPRVQETAAGVPVVRFVDVSSSAGIDFVHENGARGKKFLPETMGGGCAFFDYDGDGDQDLLLVNGMRWPEDGESPSASPTATTRLYRNDGRGHFEDVSTAAGLDVRLYGTGVAVGDHDGDGDPDVFLSAVGENHLYENRGGVFRDVTARAGVGGAADRWSTSCGFVDYDGDGDLDLFVCNYVRWSREIDLDVDFQLTGIGRAFGPPTNFAGTHSYLYRNAGDGRFEDVSATAGIQVNNPSTGEPMGKALGVIFYDSDGDGWTDILVANDTVQNFFFRNRGDGSFAERGADVGIAFDSNGLSTGAMGVDVADFRNDASLGVGIGNFANEMSSLYVTQGDRSLLLYSDEAIAEGIGPASRLMLSFGLFFFDYDLDGRLDFFQTNGHLEEEINVVQPSQHYRQPAQLFWNAGSEAPQGFTPVDSSTAGDLGEAIAGRSAAYADIDGDGDLDILITQVGDRPVLLRNDQHLGHRWLRVRLVGKAANRDAIGAWVELVAGSTTQRRQVMPTRSYLAQVELPITFGLGSADSIEALRVTWPDGSRQEFPDPETIRPGTTLVVEQAPR